MDQVVKIYVHHLIMMNMVADNILLVNGMECALALINKAVALDIAEIIQDAQMHIALMVDFHLAQAMVEIALHFQIKVTAYLLMELEYVLGFTMLVITKQDAIGLQIIVHLKLMKLVQVLAVLQ